MKSSLEEASEAAARINAMLIAKGKLKLPPVNNKTKVCSVSQKTTGDLFTAEVEINDAPLLARNMLTRGITQDEINKFSGAAVSTRGRYMNFNDRTNNSNERPLYLHIQASNKGAVDLAVEKIHRLIEQHLKSTGSTTKWSRAATTFHAPPIIGSAPPPLMSINTAPVANGQTYVQEKVFVGLEHASVGFQVKEKLLGPGDSYLNHIRIETGASIMLRGKGSGVIEPTSGRESFEPLHIQLSHSKAEGLQAAKELAINLIQTTQQEFAQWQQEQTLEIINIQNQQSALGAQQAALQQRLSSTVGLVSGGGVTLGIPQDAVVSTLTVPQATTQNATLQLGSINVNGVATSISTVLPTSLATSLVTTMPSILTTNTGAQLQLVPGQVLQRTGGIVTSALPTIVQQATQLPPVTSAAAMSLLAQSQVVYASALQQQQQSVVQASQVVASTPVPTTILSAQPQPTHLSQVVVPTHQSTATVQPSGTVAPAMFYLVTQGSVLPNPSLQVQTSPAAVQVQVQESQALVQTAAQQQQQQQVQVQQQGQQRILQQISNTQVFTAHSFAGNVAPAVATSGVVTYPQYSTQSDVYTTLHRKRKLEDELRSHTEDLRNHLRQRGLWSMRPIRREQTVRADMQSITDDLRNHLQQQQQQQQSLWSMRPPSRFLSAGLQTSMPPRLSIQGSSGSQQRFMPPPMSKTGNLTERDQHSMPPPPSPASQAVNIGALRNGELDRKRLKSALWNVNAYGSSEEDCNGPSVSLRSSRQHDEESRNSNVKSSLFGGSQRMLDSLRSSAVLQSQASSSQCQFGGTAAVAAHHMTQMSQQQQQQQAAVQLTASPYAPYVSLQNIQSHQHVPSVAVSGQIYGQQQVVLPHAQSAIHYSSHGQNGSSYWLAPN